METRKKGISLIVLVITIIVMIILAAAIILSLNNSGIIGKAKKAKTDSDTANLKEYVNVLKAEYELLEEEYKADTTMVDYVNAKLKDKGYTGALLMEDGTLYTNLQANAKTALEAGIQIGDVVEGYTLEPVASDKVYSTSGDENTAPNGTELTKGVAQTTIKRIEYETWKYIGIGENGEVLIAPDMVSADETQKIKLSGKGGFVNGPAELNDICKEMYSTDKGTARSMNIGDVTRILDYTGDRGTYYDANYLPVCTNQAQKIGDLVTLTINNSFTPDKKDIKNYYSDAFYITQGGADYLQSETEEKKQSLEKIVFAGSGYWLSSTCSYLTLSTSEVYFDVRYVSGGLVRFTDLFNNYGHSYKDSFAIRPVVEIDPAVSVSYSSGTLTLN